MTDKANNPECYLIPGKGFLSLDHISRVYPLLTDDDYPVILSGGNGRFHPKSTKTEAQLMKDYLTDKNISPDRLILESVSRSTIENLIYSRSILSDIGAKRVHIISSPEHLPRILDMARLILPDYRLIGHKTGIKISSFLLEPIETFFRAQFASQKAGYLDSHGNFEGFIGSIMKP